MRSLPSKNTRYSNWVWSQYFLMFSVGVLGYLGAGKSKSDVSIVIGIILILIGAITGIAGVAALGKNRKSSPEPHPESQPVTTGIYSHVRHPLYLSVILLCVGYSFLWVSVAAMMATVVLALFLDRKARLEEKLLCERFPEFAQYIKRTKRFIPLIY